MTEAELFILEAVTARCLAFRLAGLYAEEAGLESAQEVLRLLATDPELAEDIEAALEAERGLAEPVAALREAWAERQDAATVH